MYFSIFNLDNPHIGTSQAAYATYDASVRLAAPGDKWHAELYVINLSNKFARNNSAVQPPGYILAQFIEPRMFGLRVGTQW
jgi:iron complex outermembrane receptor protein